MCYNADGELIKGQVACDVANKAIHDTKLGKTSPPLLTKEDAEKSPGCYKGNVAFDNQGAEIFANKITLEAEIKAQCSLVPIANDLWQWVEDKTITCVDPFGKTSTGFAKCFRKSITDTSGNGAYKLRSENKGYDYPEYRTLGNDAENPRCMNIAKTKTIEGKKNCFPVWLGSTQKIKDIDQYLWLAKENAECTSSVGTVFTGEACTPNLPPSVCTSKLQQRIIAADDAFKKKPYPVDQWKCYSTWTYKRVPS